MLNAVLSASLDLCALWDGWYELLHEAVNQVAGQLSCSRINERGQRGHNALAE